LQGKESPGDHPERRFGQVGIFIRRLAAREGIKVINLVRKEEHVQVLKDQGDSHVLSMNDRNSE